MSSVAQPPPSWISIPSRIIALPVRTTAKPLIAATSAARRLFVARGHRRVPSTAWTARCAHPCGVSAIPELPHEARTGGIPPKPCHLSGDCSRARTNEPVARVRSHGFERRSHPGGMGGGRVAPSLALTLPPEMPSVRLTYPHRHSPNMRTGTCAGKNSHIWRLASSSKRSSISRSTFWRCHASRASCFS